MIRNTEKLLFSLYLIVKLRNPRSPAAYSTGFAFETDLADLSLRSKLVDLEVIFITSVEACLLPKLKTSHSVSAITGAVNTLVMHFYLHLLPVNLLDTH
jgi:hypothetical protein